MKMKLMNLAFGVLTVIFSIVVGNVQSACSRRGAECPNYQVINRFQGYEHRQYPSTTWISTTLEGPSLEDANRIMYKKLYDYVQGNNLKGMTLNTTTPVRTRIVPCHGATCATMFIMSFLIPTEHEDSPPYPNDPTLFIEKDPAMKYTVRMFEGRPTESDWIEKAHQLAQLVKKDPTVDKSYYYIAWYDPPYQLFHRHNEIWMVKKDKTSQPPPLEQQPQHGERNSGKIAEFKDKLQ